MSNIENKKIFIENLKDKIEGVMKNRLALYRECFSDCTYRFLLDYDAIWNSKLGTDFVRYITKKEGFDDTVVEITKNRTKKRLFRKNKIKKETYNETENHPTVKNLERICRIKDTNIGFKGYNLEGMPYDYWQTLKGLLILIKKHLMDFLISNQKKTLCTLTDCYKEGVLTRICELCGNTVESEVLYCSSCGEKFENKEDVRL